jgi:hypothetical protein
MTAMKGGNQEKAGYGLRFAAEEDCAAQGPRTGRARVYRPKSSQLFEHPGRRASRHGTSTLLCASFNRHFLHFARRNALTVQQCRVAE